MAAWRTGLRVLCKRLWLGGKVLWRDKGSRYSFLSVFGLVGAWLCSELSMMSSDPGYTLRANPNNSILVGVYVGSLLTCAVRIALIEYLVEKRKKMLSFLGCLGLGRAGYFGYHVAWNFAISLLLLLPFVCAVSYLLPDRSELPGLLAVVALGSLANAVYIMCLGLFFYSEITGLNVIGTFNFVVSIATSMIPKHSPLAFLLYSNPQSQLVKLIEHYALAPPELRNLDFAATAATFLGLCAAYGLLFLLVENLSKNEYGYYSRQSLCRRKAATPREPARVATDSSSFGESLSFEAEREDTEAGAKLTEEPRQPGRGSEAPDSPGPEDEQLAWLRANNVVLCVKEVKKAFGTNSVLERVSFNLQKGEILCLLGANGAGKSTLFNIILDNIEKDAGHILSPFGQKRVSFCPQHDLGWDHLTVEEHFDLILAIQGEENLPPNIASRVRDLTMLAGHWKTLAKDLSGGYKRRLTLAMALLNNSDLILMDEPTTALDMEVRYNIMRGISKARDELGSTILYTTHHLEDAENFSDSIIIMSKGSVLLKGSIEELRRQFNLVTLRLFGADRGAEAEVASYCRREVYFDCEVSSEAGGALCVRLPFESRLSLEKHVEYFETGLGLAVDIKQTSLEDVYIMDGEFDNYSAVEALGRVDMDDCWRKLTAAQRRPSFLSGYLLMVRKSSPRSPRPPRLAPRHHLLHQAPRHAARPPHRHRHLLQSHRRRGRPPGARQPPRRLRGPEEAPREREPARGLPAGLRGGPRALAAQLRVHGLHLPRVRV